MNANYAKVMQRMNDPVAQHFRLSAPLGTHWDEVPCAMVNCPYWRDGWQTLVDTGTDLGKQQAGFLRYKSNLSFREERAGDTLVRFIFSSGQKCFTVHRRQRHLVTYLKSTSLRGYLNGGMAPLERQQWLDEFSEDLYGLNLKKRRG